MPKIRSLCPPSASTRPRGHGVPDSSAAAALALVVTGLLAGCGNQLQQQAEAKAAAEGFLVALRDADYATAHARLNDNLQRVCTDPAALQSLVQEAGGPAESWTYSSVEARPGTAMVSAGVTLAGGEEGSTALAVDSIDGEWRITAWSIGNRDVCAEPRETAPPAPVETTAARGPGASVEPGATIDRASAAGVAPGAATPEDAVTHFYASMLRGDDRWKEVVVPDPSSRLERALDVYEGWRFHAFRVEEAVPSSSGAMWVKVWFDIEVDGDRDSGTDDVEVRQVGDRWLISELPT